MWQRPVPHQCWHYIRPLQQEQHRLLLLRNHMLEKNGEHRVLLVIFMRTTDHHAKALYAGRPILERKREVVGSN